MVVTLQRHGHKSTASWITDDAHIAGGRDAAIVDFAGIEQADVLVFGVDQVGFTPGRGKYVELGYALARGKRVILVGSADDCIFYNLVKERVAAWEDISRIL